MIKLLSSLKRQPAENCVILTYNLELPFFEAALFEPLYGAGCRNFIALCDPQQYQIALEDTAILRYAGQRYLVSSALSSPYGAFHPKLVLLTSKSGGQLFITSGNLSKAGYTRNWEVATEFRFNSRRPDPVAWKAFHWAFEVVEKLVSQSDNPGLNQQRLERLWGTTPWLREELPLEGNAPVWLLHNLETGLMDQIETHYQNLDGSPIDQVYVVSPFFDAKALALDALSRKFHPDTIHIYTQTAQGLSKEVIQKFQALHSSDLTIYELGAIKRRLHAKALILKSQQGIWIATGSANFSAPGLLKAANAGNTELMVLRHETEPTVFDPWLLELIQEASPINWDSLSTPPDELSEPSKKPGITLLAAYLREKNLELNVAPEPNANSLITISIQGETSISADFRQWKRLKDGWISVPFPKNFLNLAESPLRVSIKFALPDGSEESSRQVFLHNLSSLEKFSKPPRQVNRPTIPVGLITENEEHCAQILEMIQGLFITNTEQLKRHNPRVSSERKREQQEEEISEDYDPEEHIVAEPVRRLSSSLLGSDELYVDYEERLTYQEILNAVLSVTYHPPSDLTGTPDNQQNIPFELPTSEINLTLPETSIPDEELKTRMRSRITSGFKRLVENFLHGLEDWDYVQSVPPSYLLELWTIITSYMRVVWRQEILPNDLFQELSLNMLDTFWGRPSQPGTWDRLFSQLNEAEIQNEFQRLSIPLNIWVHITALSRSLELSHDRRRFDLAGWVRKFLKDSGPIQSLTKTPESTYQRAWRASFPDSYEFVTWGNMVDELLLLSQEYDEASLKEEIKAQTGNVPKIDFGNIAGKSQVPQMFLTIPLSDKELDHCWNLFRLFLTQPRFKPIAWARFENANPVIDQNDIRRITVLYRDDQKSLLFAAEREGGNHQPEIDKYISFEKIVNKAETIYDLEHMSPW